ncbi:SulP family inorganic anion transporter [Aestuariibius insulae]|uniref:SulP family inorganic anion transporter n=1 Tax=Aestuariibius insulae TaxID=2058287 RepID=UPI00345EC4C7
MASLLPPWLDGYGPKAAIADGVAGVILAVLLVPQAMAYALLAGLPPEAGLYTAMIPPLLYAVFGLSAFVSVGPVALASLLVADAIGSSGMEPMQAAAIIAIETGAILLLLGLFKLGRLVNFISEPALLGFTAAVALLIAASQLPALLGVEAARSGNLVDAAQGLLGAGLPNWPTLALGAGVLALILLGDRYAGPGLWRIGIRPPFRLPLVKSIPLLALVAAGVAASMLSLEVARVDEPGGGPPTLTLPPLSPGPWLALALDSLIVAILVFATGTAVAKSLSARRRAPLDTNREAIAVGAANVAAGLTGGYATGVSLSRSALVFDSGGRSPLATAFAGLIVLPVTLYGGPILAQLPEAALAALVISAVFGLIKLREIREVWSHSRAEAGVLGVTFVATLVLGVQWGLLTGTLAGIAAFLWFSSLPRITRLGRAGEGDIFRSVDRDEVEVDTLPVLPIRIDRSLYFGNVAHCEERILSLLSRHKDIRCVLLDMRSVNDIDASGIRMLSRLCENIEEKDLRIGFAALHAPVKEALDSCGKARLAPYYVTVEEGVDTMREECGAD